MEDRCIAMYRPVSTDEDRFALPPRFRTAWGRTQLAAKRALDVVASAAGLVVLAPVFAAIAVAVWVDTGRPIFYEWKVVGRRGRPFSGWKFRTMVVGADRLQTSLAQHNQMTGPVFKMADDPRVTPVGRFLRRYSLDELPQLWSVLCGTMSLVGPRPPLQQEWERFEPWQRRKLAVTPGITCLWQVSGRADIRDFDEWVRLDLEYIERWNLWLDATILARTAIAVLSRRGAY
jgi:lipopolysaccharide/colanic/teichoic acid biosynthesis glycosyltransferase